MYANTCVLRTDKMACPVKLDYSEGEVRNVNLSRSRPHPNVSRGKTKVKTSRVEFGCSR